MSSSKSYIEKLKAEIIRHRSSLKSLTFRKFLAWLIKKVDDVLINFFGTHESEAVNKNALRWLIKVQKASEKRRMTEREQARQERIKKREERKSLSSKKESDS